MPVRRRLRGGSSPTAFRYSCQLATSRRGTAYAHRYEYIRWILPLLALTAGPLGSGGVSAAPFPSHLATLTAEGDLLSTFVRSLCCVNSTHCRPGCAAGLARQLIPLCVSVFQSCPTPTPQPLEPSRFAAPTSPAADADQLRASSGLQTPSGSALALSGGTRGGPSGTLWRDSAAWRSGGRYQAGSEGGGSAAAHCCLAVASQIAQLDPTAGYVLSNHSPGEDNTHSAGTGTSSGGVPFAAAAAGGPVLLEDFGHWLQYQQQRGELPLLPPAAAAQAAGDIPPHGSPSPAAAAPGDADSPAAAGGATLGDSPPLLDTAAAGTPAAAAAAQDPAAPAAEPAPAAASPTPPAPSSSYDYERYNLAYSKDGAKVVAAHAEARKPAALLDQDADTFLKTDCKVDKWVVVELSQVAKVDSLELAQHEPYTSLVRDFELLGRQGHPRQDLKESAAGGAGPQDYREALEGPGWHPLGRFTAEKRKGSQTFRVAEPRWVRYVALRWLSEYGGEKTCAINGLAVYGKTATQDLEDRLTADLEEPQQAQQQAAAAAVPPPPAAAATQPLQQPQQQAGEGGASTVAAAAGQPPAQVYPGQHPTAAAAAAQAASQAAPGNAPEHQGGGEGAGGGAATAAGAAAATTGSAHKAAGPEPAEASASAAQVPAVGVADGTDAANEPRAESGSDAATAEGGSALAPASGAAVRPGTAADGGGAPGGVRLPLQEPPPGQSGGNDAEPGGSGQMHEAAASTPAAAVPQAGAGAAAGSGVQGGSGGGSHDAAPQQPAASSSNIAGSPQQQGERQTDHAMPQAAPGTATAAAAADSPAAASANAAALGAEKTPPPAEPAATSTAAAAPAAAAAVPAQQQQQRKVAGDAPPPDLLVMSGGSGGGGGGGGSMYDRLILQLKDLKLEQIRMQAALQPLLLLDESPPTAASASASSAAAALSGGATVGAGGGHGGGGGHHGSPLLRALKPKQLEALAGLLDGLAAGEEAEQQERRRRQEGGGGQGDEDKQVVQEGGTTSPTIPAADAGSGGLGGGSGHGNLAKRLGLEIAAAAGGGGGAGGGAHHVLEALQQRVEALEGSHKQLKGQLQRQGRQLMAALHAFASLVGLLSAHLWLRAGVGAPGVGGAAAAGAQRQACGDGGGGGAGKQRRLGHRPLWAALVGVVLANGAVAALPYARVAAGRLGAA